MSIVSETIAARRVEVSTPQGTFLYLKGAIDSVIDKWIDRMADLNFSTAEKMRQVVEDVIGAKMTEAQCALIKSMPGLFPAVAAEHDQDIMTSFEKAYYADTIGQGMQMKTFMAAARKRVALDVVHAFKHQAENEDNSPEVKKAALEAFGFSPEEIRTAQWSGSTVTVNYGDPVNFYERAGLTPEEWA
jgi:hypothetical protein